MTKDLFYFKGLNAILVSMMQNVKQATKSPFSWRGVAGLVIMGLCLLGTTFAADTSVGAAELSLLDKIFTGNIGLVLGLAVAVAGLWKFAHGDFSGAVMMMVLAVLLTLLPGVYNGLRLIVCPIARTLGGQCGSGS